METFWKGLNFFFFFKCSLEQLLFDNSYTNPQATINKLLKYELNKWTVRFIEN